MSFSLGLAMKYQFLSVIEEERLVTLPSPKRMLIEFVLKACSL